MGRAGPCFHHAPGGSVAGAASRRTAGATPRRTPSSPQVDSMAGPGVGRARRDVMGHSLPVPSTAWTWRSLARVRGRIRPAFRDRVTLIGALARDLVGFQGPASARPRRWWNNRPGRDERGTTERKIPGATHVDVVPRTTTRCRPAPRSARYRRRRTGSDWLESATDTGTHGPEFKDQSPNTTNGRSAGVRLADQGHRSVVLRTGALGRSPSQIARRSRAAFPVPSSVRSMRN